MSSVMDPMTVDWFSPPRTHVPAPTPHVTAPKLLPDVDRLFAVQRALVKAAHAAIGVQESHDKRLLQDSLGDAYRSINSYLRDYATPLPAGAGTVE